MEELKKLTDVEFIELDATLVKDDAAFEAEVKRCLDREEAMHPCRQNCLLL